MPSPKQGGQHLPVRSARPHLPEFHGRCCRQGGRGRLPWTRAVQRRPARQCAPDSRGRFVEMQHAAEPRPGASHAHVDTPHPVPLAALRTPAGPGLQRTTTSDGRCAGHRWIRAGRRARADRRPTPVEWHVGLGTDGEELMKASRHPMVDSSAWAIRQNARVRRPTSSWSRNPGRTWTTRIGRTASGTSESLCSRWMVATWWLAAPSMGASSRPSSSSTRDPPSGRGRTTKTAQPRSGAWPTCRRRPCRDRLPRRLGIRLHLGRWNRIPHGHRCRGQERWSVDIDPPQGTKIRQTPDGGFAVLSTVGVGGRPGPQECGHREAGATGTTEWIRTYGGAENNQAFDFDMTPEEASSSQATRRIRRRELGLSDDVSRQDGTLEWSTRLGQPRGYDPAFIHRYYSVRVDRDGGFVIAGGTGDEYDHSEDGHPSGRSDSGRGISSRSTRREASWAQVYGDAPGAGHNATEFSR